MYLPNTDRMKKTIDYYIDSNPVAGILGKYRFIDEDVCLGVLGKNAKFKDYIVSEHIKQVVDHAGVPCFYAIIDLRNLLWADIELAYRFSDGSFTSRIKACAILAETDLSRKVAEECFKGMRHTNEITIVDNLDMAFLWIQSKKKSLGSCPKNQTTLARLAHN